MRKGTGWGLFLISIAGLSALSIEALSADPNSGLIGGAPVGSNQPPKLFTPTSFILGNDPFANFEPDFCEQEVKRRSATRLANSQINNPNAKQLATQAMGGLIGGLIAGGGGTDRLGEGLQSGISGEACLDQDITASTSPKLSCSDYKNGDGKFDDSKEREMLDEIANQSNANSMASCQSSAAEEAADLTDCYEKQHKKLLADMLKVKKDFELNIKNANASASALDTEIKKEEVKQEELDKQAKGLAESAENLRALHRKLNAPSSGVPNGGETSITGLRQSVQDHRAKFDAFKERMQVEKARGISRCMSDGGGAFSSLHNCANGNGDITTPKACILSIYSDSILTSLSGGGNHFSNADRKKAEVRTKMFSQRLEQMLGEFSTGRVRDVRQFKSAFSSDLNQMGGKAAGQMLSEIETCAQQSADDQERQIKDGVGIGADLAAFGNDAQTISSGLGSTLLELDTGLRQAYLTAFGKDAGDNFNGFKCHSTAVAGNAPRGADGSATGVAKLQFQEQSLESQVNCVEEFNQVMFQMLNGTSAPGFEPKPGQAAVPLQLTIKVTGPNGSPVDATDKDGNRVTCSGLDNCARTAAGLATASKQLVADMRGEGKFTSKLCPQGCQGLAGFKKSFNSQIREALAQSATDFGRRVDAAAKALARVKKLLSKTGADLGGEVEKTDLEEVCPTAPAGEGEEICTLKGKDFDKMLAGLAGVEKLEPGDFRRATETARERRKKAVADATAFEKNAKTLRTELAICQNSRKKDATNDRLAKFDAKMNKDLAKCKNGIPADEKQSYDVGANFAGLETDFASLCEESTGERCTELGEKMANLRSECQQVVNASRNSNKAPNFYFGNPPAAPAAAAVNGGGSG